jgi:hypothetical protein
MTTSPRAGSSLSREAAGVETAGSIAATSAMAPYDERVRELVRPLLPPVPPVLGHLEAPVCGLSRDQTSREHE